MKHLLQLFLILCFIIYLELYAPINQYNFKSSIKLARYSYSYQSKSNDIYFLELYLLMIGLLLVYMRRYKKQMMKFLHTLTKAILFNILISNLIKTSSGRLRPDFYDRLEIGDEKLIREGQLSFVSGHTSAAFCCSFFIFKYIKKIKVNVHLDYFFILLIQMIVLFVAYCVGISRLMENKHHIEDVIAGALVGTGIANEFFNNCYAVDAEKPKKIVKDDDDETKELLELSNV